MTSKRSGSLTEQVHGLLSHYNNYREKSLPHRLFDHRDIEALITPYLSANLVSESASGRSVEGRAIHHLTLGSGPVPVMMWSQMHGDEPTATMALFDLLRFLSAHDQEGEPLRRLLLEKLTLHLIPVVNPDGMDRYQRRNAAGIDLNRDAVALQAPESRFLMDAARRVRPRYGFNLHDQMRYYTAGHSAKPAGLTFLAPPVDVQGSVPPHRSQAMKLISGLSTYLISQLPGRIGSYSDEYEHRAFGDTFQRMGIATILIETGGHEMDPDKQLLRKWNFAAYLYALAMIGRDLVDEYSTDACESLSENRRRYFDLIIRNARVGPEMNPVLADIAINRTESLAPNGRHFHITGQIADIGDLSPYHGYEELDAGGGQVRPGAVFAINSGGQLPPVAELLREGYTGICNGRDRQATGHPLNRHSSRVSEAGHIAPGEPADLVIGDANDTGLLIINGFVIDPAAGEWGEACPRYDSQ